MKKKLIAITAISAILVGGSALSISANNDGYQLYKTALKNTHTLASTSASIESTVTINEEVKQTIDFEGKYNLEQKAAQGTISLVMNNQAEQLDIALQDKHFYILNKNKTYEIERKNETEENTAHHDPELMKIGEKIMDTLTVPLHDEFKIHKNTISLDLTNKDIPAIFREIGQYMVKKGTAAHENATMSTSEYPFLTENLSASLPVLTDNIKIERVQLNAELTEENLIANQTMSMMITGEDKNGEFHEIEMNVKMAFENMNETMLKNIQIDENAQKIELRKAHH